MRALMDWLKQELYIATGLPVQVGAGDTPLGEGAYWVVDFELIEPGEAIAGLRYLLTARLEMPIAPESDAVLHAMRLVAQAEGHLMDSAVRDRAPALDVQAYPLDERTLSVRFEVPVDAPVV